jgi:predicted nucleotidyltransferase
MPGDKCIGNAIKKGPFPKRKIIIFVHMNDVETNIQSIKDLCINHKVDKLYLFGSILGNGYNEKSDIDFVVRFKDIELLQYADNYFDFKFSLEDLLNRSIDLLEEPSIKNPYFLESLNESKKLIYG